MLQYLVFIDFSEDCKMGWDSFVDDYETIEQCYAAIVLTLAGKTRYYRGLHQWQIVDTMTKKVYQERTGGFPGVVHNRQEESPDVKARLERWLQEN